MKFNISIDVERDLHSDGFKGITEGLEILDKILKKYDIKATLFVTGEIFEKYKELFEKYEGYEISYHGYSHKRFDNLGVSKEFIDYNFLGFRAPQHSIDYSMFKTLKDKNFKYDSSYTPLNFLQVLFFPKWISIKHFFSKRKPYFKNGILEIPTSSFIFPFGGVTLRLMPLWFSKLLYYFLNKEIILFYMHSWDLIELKNSKAYFYCDKECFLKKFKGLVKFLNERGEWVLLRNYK